MALNAAGMLMMQGTEYEGGGGALGAIVGLAFSLIWIALTVLIIAGIWKVFTKAGQPGWASLVPIYNIYILTKIAGRPAFWLLFLFVQIPQFV